MENFDTNITLDGENIDLSLYSKDELKEILSKINDNELKLKQEIDEILQKLT